MDLLYLRPVFQTADGVHLGIGFVGVSLAFGLTVVTMAYGIGHISGAHLNPARLRWGHFLGGRMNVKDVVSVHGCPMCRWHCCGVLVVLYLQRRTGNTLPQVTREFAMGSVNILRGNIIWSLLFAAEAVLTFMFLMVHSRGHRLAELPQDFAGLAIGFVSRPDSPVLLFQLQNCSVNPARSLGPAIVAMVNGDGWPFAAAMVCL